MDLERLQELALTLALGAADAEAEREFATLRRQAPADADRELAQARRLVQHLAYSTPEQEPPAEVKERLLRNVKTLEAQAAVRRTASVRPMASSGPRVQLRWSRVLAWAAVFVAVALGYGYINVQERARSLNEEVTLLRSQLAERQATIGLLEGRLAQQHRVLQVVRAPQLRLVELQSTQPDHQGRGRVLIDPVAVRAVFAGENLPSLPADKDYELWYIIGTRPVNAGVFQVDENGAVAFEIKELPAQLQGIHTFAVTMEPKGGVPQPTGAILIAGKVGA